MVGRWEGGWGWQNKKVKGLRSTRWQLQQNQGDVKYGTGNRVDNISLTMYGARWVLDSWGRG